MIACVLGGYAASGAGGYCPPVQAFQQAQGVYQHETTPGLPNTGIYWLVLVGMLLLFFLIGFDFWYNDWNIKFIVLVSID